MTGYLVVGSGLAGISFSLRVAKHSPVTIITKNLLMDSNSSQAQGGIAAVMRPPDSFEKHVRDTLNVAQGLGNKKAISLMVKEGPEQIQWLIEQGVQFDRYNGDLHLTREGGHSGRRVVHAGDITGGEVQKVLINNLSRNPNITIHENVIGIDLIIENGICRGLVAYNEETEKILRILSHTTVLATGGVGQLYAKTSNPGGATGDGIAMAWRAGAAITDMEFIQFHPTILDKGESPYFLISEAVRGEGGVLVDYSQVPFMPRYHALLDLAPRDIVSRAIVEEQKRGQVYVDIRHHGKDFLSKRFPGISEECLKRGIDISKDLIPVTPAAHYLCGGIKTNEYGETSISGLLAFGECSQTGVHGANRMASNSLLECLAFTAISARNQTINNQENKVYTQKYETKIVESASQIKSELQTTMWDNVGIIRNYVGLENALNSVERLRKRLELITGINKEIIETRNMIDVASLIVKAALTRKESRGTHNMDEYHFKDDEKWLKHIVFKGDKLEIKKFD